MPVGTVRSKQVTSVAPGLGISSEVGELWRRVDVCEDV